MREAVVAIYHFARTADDIADEGDQAPEQRLCELKAYRLALEDTLQGRQCRDPDAPWSDIFRMLAIAHANHHLPSAPLHDLLDAFEQDVRNPAYTTRDELLDYCRRSANPIGRLLLHLHGVNGEALITMSDKVCSALQLINFWQDLSVDIPRGRFYLTRQDQLAFGVSQRDLEGLKQTDNATQLIANCVLTAREMMGKGAQLVHHVPGRAGWELRAVVQGGLQILDKIERLKFTTLRHRPTLGKRDGPLILWRCLWM
jgi:squalene synthase HpnC